MDNQRKPGAVEILCKEIGVHFDERTETSAVLVAFVRVLVGQVDEMRAWRGHLSNLIGKEPSAESGNVLARVKSMLDAPDDKAMILSASCAHDYINEVCPEDMYPTDHFIDMLSSCVSAVRFGLEYPCNSRHAAAAASHIWKHRYGVSLFDSFTPAWEKDWARAQFRSAILSLVPTQ